MSTLQLLLTIWVQCYTLLAEESANISDACWSVSVKSCATGTWIAGLQNKVLYQRIHQRQTKNQPMLTLQNWEGRAKK